MNDEQKIKQAHEHLRSLMWDDYTERLFGVARLTSSFKTKNLNESEVEYIIDGLNHKGRFRKDWEGREEFLWRFMDTLVNRSRAGLFLSAAVAASQRGVDWGNKPDLMAETSYEQWAKDRREEYAQQAKQWLKDYKQQNENKKEAL